MKNFILEYRNLNKLPVAYVFDEEMLKHVADFEHPENPKRLKLLHEKFLEIKLDSRCKNVPVSIGLFGKGISSKLRIILVQVC